MNTPSPDDGRPADPSTSNASHPTLPAPRRVRPLVAFPSPRLHVVVPTHNRADLIVRCLGALCEQTVSDLHVVVVDDASDSAARETLLRWQDEHSDFNLSLFLNERNLGANPSRNMGVAFALSLIEDKRVGLVALLDNDSIAEPTWAENIVVPFDDDRVAAATGLVLDPDPPNVWTLAYKGTHRVVTRGPAHRMVSCNLCLRAEPLERFTFGEALSPNATTVGGAADTAVSGRSDEEGLYLKLKRAGYSVVSAPDAVVLHDHTYTARSFFKQAFRSGRAAARLVYRYRLAHRLDMAPLAAAYLTLVPAALLAPMLGAAPLLIPAMCFAAAVAAYLYNERSRKRKAFGEITRSFHVVLLYYHVRLAGYLLQHARFAFRVERPPRFDLASIRPRFTDQATTKAFADDRRRV